MVGALALVAGAALAWDPSPDRYDPARLEAIAIEHARAGDWSAARILLERATRLVPGDARIAKSLVEVRNGRVPSAPPAPPTATKPRTPERVRDLPSEPPPLWPPRK